MRRFIIEFGGRLSDHLLKLGEQVQPFLKLLVINRITSVRL